MGTDWINEILDEAVKEVKSWPLWAQQERVRVAEPDYDLPVEDDE